jgi:hypothetical protein
MTAETCEHCGGRIIDYGIEKECENNFYNVATKERGTCTRPELTTFDAVDFLESGAIIKAFLYSAIEEDDEEFLMKAIDDVAEAFDRRRTDSIL